MNARVSKSKRKQKNGLKTKQIYTCINLHTYKLVSGGTHFHHFQILSVGWLIGWSVPQAINFL
jgi:hypothetical protein